VNIGPRSTPSRHDVVPTADVPAMPESRRYTLQVVVLALVTYGEDRDDITALDLE
jgi:hypothetical protein